jgi:serine/threonine protein kinase
MVPPSRRAAPSFHAIRLAHAMQGDRVGGRFTLLHKVGHDSTGTRWIARHQQVLSPYSSHLAEVKSFSALDTKEGRSTRELEATKTLQGSRRPSARLLPDDPLYQIQVPYESFEEKRLGDSHAFHVYASFGPRVTDIVRYSPLKGVEGRLDTAISRKIIKDITAAVASMHDRGVIHGGQSSTDGH